MEKCQMLQRKILSLSNLSLFESETIFSRKIISERKKQIIAMDLCPATFRSFAVQWQTNIAGRWPQLKPLICIYLCVCIYLYCFKINKEILPQTLKKFYGREKYWPSLFFITTHGMNSLTDLYCSKCRGYIQEISFCNKLFLVSFAVFLAS